MNTFLFVRNLGAFHFVLIPHFSFVINHSTVKPTQNDTPKQIKVDKINSESCQSQPSRKQLKQRDVVGFFIEGSHNFKKKKKKLSFAWLVCFLFCLFFYFIEAGSQ